MKIRHFGNTANNAYFNAMLLRDFAGIESELPIRMFGLAHAISAPAWEALEFDVPSAPWVHHPDWSLVPGAVELNSEYTDLPVPLSDDAARVRFNPRNAAMSVARAVLEPLHGRRWAQPIFDLSYRWVLARTVAPAQVDGVIDVLYGADSLVKMKMPRSASQFVCVEHGTVRSIYDGEREISVFRRAYRDQVRRSRHLWVTNLDPRTLEIAEEVAPGRWSALPHPYVPDPRAPFAGSPEHREELLRATDSESVVLLPSSQNWSKHHDKGSMKALKAFVELRKSGRDVGLVAIEWGLQVAESKAFLKKAGVSANVVWVRPMARVSLQRMMADVDVVWDQFGLEAFGGLAIRTMEQGAPLISRGLAPAGERLLGGPAPWRHAATAQEVAHETAALLDEIAEKGRDRVLSEYRSRARAWFLETHSPLITARLQSEVYSGILDGTWEPGSAAPDRWAQLVREGIPTGRDTGRGKGR